MKNDNEIIQEGLDLIDSEMKTEDEIEQKTSQIVAVLINNAKGSASKVRVPITCEDGKEVPYLLALQSFKTKTVSGNVTKIVLTALNEERFKIANDLQMPYKPATYACDYDPDFSYDENVRALVRAFIAKSLGTFRVEVLEEDKDAVKVIKENKK